MHGIRGADSIDKIAVPVSQNYSVTSFIWDNDGIFSRCPFEDTSDAVRCRSSTTEEPLGGESSGTRSQRGQPTSIAPRIKTG